MVDNHAGPSSTCIDDETLAAFVDGTLEPSARSRIVAHLGACADCSSLVAEVAVVDEELRDVAAIPMHDPFQGKHQTASTRFWSRGRLAAAVGGLAIAASVLLIVANRESQLDPLVGIVGNERMTVARPTGGFHYGPLRSTTRGPRDSGNLALLAEAARLGQRAEQTAAAEDVHASGVAHLIAGDVARSVPLLESAARLKPDDAAFRTDLGAAHMTRFIERGDQADATSALEEFEQALALAPSTKEAWFNKALLLERLNRPADAIAAWTKYMELPDEEGWRQEAARTRDAIQRQPG